MANLLKKSAIFLSLTSLFLTTACIRILSSDGQYTGLQVGQGHGGNPASNGTSAESTTTTAPSGPTTVSSWMGMNISGDLMFNDITHQIAPFDTAAANKDSLGFPLPGFNGNSSGDFGFLLPTGDYNISFVGTGSVTVSGIGVLTGTWQTVGNEQRNVLHITGTPMSFGNFLTISITNGPSQSVTNLHIFLPGVAYDTTELFYANVLTLLKPFRQMRFMGEVATIDSSVVNWTDANVSTLPFASNFAWDAVVALINETGKDAWLNIPALASDTYITDFGTYLLSNLNMAQINQLRSQQGYSTPFRIYIEYSNEVWASTSANAADAYNHLLTVANSNTYRYDGAYSQTYGPSWATAGSNVMKVEQAHADRIISITTALRKQFAAVGQPDCITPVLAGWALGAAFSAVALEFVAKNYPNPVSSYIPYIAIAPYFGVTDDSQTNDLSNLFLNIGDGTTPGGDGISSATATYADFKKLITQYGIQMAAYEGGQGLSGSTNTNVKLLAQVDSRMYKAYVAYYKIWTSTFGQNAPFNHFALGGDPGMPEFIGQPGWWSVPSILTNITTCTQGFPTLLGNEDWITNTVYCPKYAAIMNL